MCIYIYIYIYIIHKYTNTYIHMAVNYNKHHCGSIACVRMRMHSCIMNAPHRLRDVSGQGLKQHVHMRAIEKTLRTHNAYKQTQNELTVNPHCHPNAKCNQFQARCAQVASTGTHRPTHTHTQDMPQSQHTTMKHTCMHSRHPTARCPAPRAPAAHPRPPSAHCWHLRPHPGRRCSPSRPPPIFPCSNPLAAAVRALRRLLCVASFLAVARTRDLHPYTAWAHAARCHAGNSVSKRCFSITNLYSNPCARRTVNTNNNMA